MKYYVQRQLNEYGPYTLADLQRYIAQGNILLTDLTRSEGMTDWVPVSQVIGNIPVPVPPATMQFPGGPTYGGGGAVYGETPTYGGQAVAPLANAPVPPDFHWAPVLVISIVTCGLFGWAWLFVEAAYVKKIKQDSKGLLFAILSFLAFFMPVLLRTGMGPSEASPINGLLWLAGLVLLFVGLFQMQSDLEDHYNTVEPINLQLNGVMTFFFGILYFQHHFSRIAQWKKSGYLQPQGQ